MTPVRKYLEQYAEPEAALAASIEGRYERVLVVPACREEPALLDGYVAAAETAHGRTLCILVVNGMVGAPEAVHADNAQLLRGVLERLRNPRAMGRAWHGSLVWDTLDVLVVDRASEGVRLPRKQGVGLARKIGTDVALALYDRGFVASRFVFGTDADSALAPTHFDLPELEDRTDVAAVVLPFWHEPADDPAVTHATSLYELSLRYYVAGLGWAGSPYAFHSLGSATAFCLPSYARVRGYPKREAAEDFYLLNKIAKVGSVVRAPGPGVRIRSRRSDRTPFGTGRRVASALESGSFSFYAPRVFYLLGEWLRMLDVFCRDGAMAAFDAGLSTLSAEERAPFRAALSEPAFQRALHAASEESKTPEARWRRVHSFFDAFRTLKLVHLLRDRVAPNVDWHEAVDAAPFSPEGSRLLSHSDPSLAELRRAFFEAERGLRAQLGPAAGPVTRARRESWQPSSPPSSLGAGRQ